MTDTTTTEQQYKAELQTLAIEQPKTTPRGVYIHTTGHSNQWRSTVLRDQWPLYISPTENSPRKAYEHARKFVALIRESQ